MTAAVRTLDARQRAAPHRTATTEPYTGVERCGCASVEEIKFTRELSDVKLTSSNQTATFECELSKAGLKVEWTKDGQRLRRGDRVDTVSDTRTHRLVIENAGPDDVGKYTAVYEKLTTSAALAVVSKSAVSLAGS